MHSHSLRRTPALFLFGLWSLVLASGTPIASAQADASLGGTASPVPARAFVLESERVIRLNSGRPEACFQVEPVSASFDIGKVFLRSMKLLYADTNPSGASKIVTCGATLDRDTDRNGVAEIRVCFSKADLRRLLADVSARSTVAVSVYGALEVPGTSNWFEAPVSIDVVGDGSIRIRPTEKADVSQK